MNIETGVFMAVMEAVGGIAEKSLSLTSVLHSSPSCENRQKKRRTHLSISPSLATQNSCKNY